MQNAQNIEIQQRVINLVELYRTKVGKESEIAKKAKAENEWLEQENLRLALEARDRGEAFFGGFIDNGNQSEVWTKQLMVNEQLLGHFYAKVASENADKRVLKHLLPDLYDSSIFSEEEELFLVDHFREMVNYIVQTPSNDLSYVQRYDEKDSDLIPEEVLSLIKSKVDIPAGSIIYNPFAGFGQFANCFPDSKFYCEESYSSFAKEWNAFSDKCYKTANQILGKQDVYSQWSWLKVALYANRPDAVIIEDSLGPTSYDAFVAFLPYLPKLLPNSSLGNYNKLPTDLYFISIIRKGYMNLREGGNMVLIVPNKALCDVDVEKPFGTFWGELIKDQAIIEIIQLPSVMSHNLNGDCSIVFVKKNEKAHLLTMTDARFAYNTINTAYTIEELKNANALVGKAYIPFYKDGEYKMVTNDKNAFHFYLDINALLEVANNNGRQLETGFRKRVQIPYSEINEDMLLPQFYVIERPSEDVCPRRLSDLCTFETMTIEDSGIRIVEEIPWVKLDNLSISNNSVIDLTKLEKIGENADSNNLNIDDSDLFTHPSLSKDEYRSLAFRTSTYVSGKEDVVVFLPVVNGVGAAIIKSSGTPVAVNKGLYVVRPKEGMRAESLLALIRMPLVYRQIVTYEEYGVINHLKDIFVPTDQRVIYDLSTIVMREDTIIEKLKKKLDSQKTEYINEVRMRKHDMGQYIFELGNIEDLMRFYVENHDKEQDFCQELKSLLDNFRSSLGELSTLLDNLSKEEQFGTPEVFDIDNYLSQLKDRHHAEGYQISYSTDVNSILAYNQKRKSIIKQDDHEASLEICEKPEVSLETYDEQGDNLKVYNEPEDNLDIYDESEESLESYDELESSKEIYDEKTIDYNTSKIFALMKAPILYVAPNDLQRAVNNIIDNARKHGFSDATRKDYEIKVFLSIDVERELYQIEFRNNGNPLPDGMDKMRYGLKGEKAGPTGGTGLGGNYVKSFAEHYGGDYDIFMDNGWTVVRICLPIK